MAKYELDNFAEVNFSAEGKVVDEVGFNKLDFKGELVEVSPAGMNDEILIGFVLDDGVGSDAIIEGYIGLNAYWLAELDSEFKSKGEDYLFSVVKEVINNYKAEIAKAISKLAKETITADSVEKSLTIPQQTVKVGFTGMYPNKAPYLG